MADEREDDSENSVPEGDSRSDTHAALQDPDAPHHESGDQADGDITESPFPVVGVVASAGGVEAFKSFFKAMPGDSGMAFVLVPHLDPSHESMMATLVGRTTDMPVSEAQDGQRLAPNHVYVIPPDHFLSLDQGVIRLRRPAQKSASDLPIDPFLRSLADDQHEWAIGIILSGTGSYGSAGLKAIKGAGGMVMVQEPSSAEYESMPTSAIDTGLADYVLAPEQMPKALLDYVRHFPIETEEAVQSPDVEQDLSQVLALIQARTRFDFRAYRKRMVLRRVLRRMGINHLDTLSDYAALLRDQPDELQRLCKDLLISVTAFFRNPEMYEVLQTLVLPDLIEGRAADAPIRVWVPGCATGEEAYSIAILLLEALNAAGKTCPVQVFATDVDENALEVGRRGVYPESVVNDLGGGRVEHFFTKVDGHKRQVKKFLREAVLFAPQKLLTDAPFSRLDLVSCRNLLIYLESQVQQMLLQLFHFALKEGGFLMLGSSESIGRQVDLFQPVSRKWRIFRRLSAARRVHANFPIQPGERRAEQDRASPPVQRQANALQELTRKILVEKYAPAAVVIDTRFHVLHYSGPTHLYLQQPDGPPCSDLLSLAYAGLRPRIRAVVQGALGDKQHIEIQDLHIKRDGRNVPVRMRVQALPDRRLGDKLFLITFQDEPQTLPGPAPAAAAHPDASDQSLVQQLEFELKSTREELQSTIEELESSNEELKVSNEEVMSINEELQSTNEELESSKEELQSLNEELSTVNNQLQDKVEELESSNNDMDNLIASVDTAILFLAPDHTIQRFTPSATRLFNLIDSDLGRPLSDISYRCQDADLEQDIRQVLNHVAPISKEVQGQDDHWYLRQITSYRRHDGRVDGVVLTFTDITQLKQTELELREMARTLEQRVVTRTAELEDEIQERRVAQESLAKREWEFRAIFADAPVGMCQVEPQSGRLLVVNARFRQMTGYRDADLQQRSFVDLLHPDDRPVYFEQLSGAAQDARAVYQCEQRFLHHDGNVVWGEVKTIMVRDAEGVPLYAIIAVADISQRKALELNLAERREQLEAERNFKDVVLDTVGSLIIVIDQDEKLVQFNPACESLTGHRFDALKGTDAWWKLIPADEADSVRSVVDRLAAGERLVVNENHWFTKGGDMRLISWRSTAIRNTAGEIQCIVGSGTDVTEQRKAESEARQHLEEASRLQRLQTANELATTLAHELNQPLATIIMHADSSERLLHHPPLDPEQIGKKVRDISEQAMHAGEIIRRLRKFVGRNGSERVPMDLNGVIRRACGLMKSKALACGINIRLKLDDTLPPVLADEVHIEQVVLNLLRNAIEAIYGAQMTGGVITVYSRAVNEAAQVSVVDTGPGLDENTAAGLFEKLASDKPYGLGVGLRISLSLIQSSGGRLWVEPQQPGGIFHFRLPFAP